MATISTSSGTTGDDRAAAELQGQYDELRRLAATYLRAERSGHTLGATGLVHEAFIRLADDPRLAGADRVHVFRLAAQAMRQALIDSARRRRAAKRGGDATGIRVTLSGLHASSPGPIDLVAVDRALVELRSLDSRQADIVELRVFARQTIDEIAQLLRISKRTVDIDWKMARAWLHAQLVAPGGGA